MLGDLERLFSREEWRGAPAALLVMSLASSLAFTTWRLLLDNFAPADMQAAVELRNESYPDVTLEASGGVNLDSVAAIAATGVDFVSVGALTKDIRAVDFSMRFKVV